MSNQRFKAFEIDGHKYTVTTHDTTEALPIVAALLAALPGPLLQAIQLLKEKHPNRSFLELDFSDLGGIEFGKIGEDLSKAIESIGARPQLIKSVFRHTERDGQSLGGAHFETVYSGNWGEFYKALFQIVKANGFIPLGSTSQSDGEE